MLRKVQRTIEETIDVELPMFLKRGPFYIKVISESEYYEVSKGEHVGIKTSSTMVDFFITTGEPSTSEEFTAALTEEKDRLKELLSENPVLELNDQPRPFT